MKNPHVHVLLEAGAIAGIARPHSWCTCQEKASFDSIKGAGALPARSASLRATQLGRACNSPSSHGPREAPALEMEARSASTTR